VIAASCIGFAVDCATLAKGGLAVIVGVVLFVGSVLLMLSAVFGRRMGYLVLAVSFFSWMILLSAVWTFGFFSQGPTTPVNLGPRGAEPAWTPIAAGQNVSSATYPEFDTYPGGPWKAPGDDPNPQLTASIQSATSAIQTFLAERANAELGIEEPGTDPEAIQTTDFTVQNLRFAAHEDVSLAAAQAFFNEGGPVITVFAYHDRGSAPRYSWMFLIGSIIGFAVHVPLLDRAEKKRKEILTGGTAPPWYGPA
jgi:hypothetical protein